MKRLFTIPSKQNGAGPVQFEWQKRFGSYIASVGFNNVVYICDRHGELVDSINLPGECTGMEWSPDGELLAIIQSKSGIAYMWDANTRRQAPQIDTGMRHLEFLRWSPKAELLAIGTSKGNLLIYDRRLSKKVPILGKHTKAISTGCWSWDNILACGSDDRTFTLSNPEGDTVYQMGLKGDPSNMQWANMKTSDDQTSPVLTMILSGKTLFFYNVNNPDAPMELAFQPNYGHIVTYHWFGDGFVLLGFTSGYVVVISTNISEMGQELFQTRDHRDALTDIAVSPILNKAATCGDNSIKIHDLADMKDTYAIITLDDDRGQLDKLQWSDDGQFLSVGTKEGNVYTYLAKMPTLGGAWETSVAYLTNLKEVSVADQSQSTSRSASAQPKLIRKALEIEPTVVAVGQNHVGVALNNRAWFYSLQIESEVIPNDQRGIPNETPIIKEYLASVKTLHMNTDYAAALLSDGRLQLHTIEKAGSISTISLAPPAMRSQYDISPSAHSPSPAVPKSNKKLDVQQKIFPEKEVTTKTEGGAGGAGFSISCAALTAEFLVYGTANGVVHHYAVDEWVLVNEYKHEKEIQKVYPQYHGGTKCIFSDVLNDGYLVEPISNEVMQIPQWSANTQGVLWETSQAPGRSIFVTWDDEYITTYAYEAVTIKGPQCLVLGATKLPYGLKPLLLLSGMLTCQTPGGRLSVVPLATHEPDTLAQFTKLYPEEQEQGKRLQLLYTLGKLKDIWSLTDTITSHKPWIMLGEAALRVLDIHVARRAYRHVRNAGMVHTLDGLESIEDKTLLAGHIAAIFMDFNAAQELFLDSPNPLAALELRRNLLHWEQALSLATNLAPDEVTVIAREYAQQLEFDEKYSEAIAMYERALSTSDKHPGPDAARDDHQIACSAGLTRMTIRLGDISRGMKMLAHATDQQLLSDCGGILDGLKQYAEAASCYERCGKWERAAEVWIKAKNWQKIGSLLDKVTAPKIFVQYAKAKEAEGQYPEAARAYEKAKDYDSVVRLLVDHMQNIDGAVSIVRKTRSRDSAKIVAKFFQGIRDYRSVVEFYLMAGMREEAFELAQQRDVMDHYAELVKDDATHEELLNIASYFEHKRDYLSAGKHLLHCGEYPRALKMFLLCSAADGASIELAIETVGLAHNDSLTHQLIDYLMGETDGLPKDAKYIFKLYMSLGQYKEAARTAVIIAREEQTLGNYRAAHDLLLDNYRQLRATKEKVPSEIDRMLMLLHSYILVKTLVRAGEHEKGARMLIRVSSNISKFPAHIVPILTSTVIECHRVGLKRSAFEYAAMLMRPEYRNQVDAKYKRKIEQIVRRPEKEEPEETMTPCPYCDNPVPETSLDCIECKNHLPYCIATGRHMTTNDWTTCPNCAFPALMSHFADLLAKSPTCPMCATALAPDQLKPVKNPSEYLHGKKEGVEHVEKVRGGDDENVDIVPAAAALERVGSALTGASTESDGMGSGQLRGTGGMVV